MRNPPYARSAGPGGPPLPARATIGLYGRDEIFPLFLVADRVILLATPGFLLGLFPGVPGALFDLLPDLAGLTLQLCLALV